MRILCVLFLLAVSLPAAKTLDIYFIDVEGGQATLIVAPTGESLLVDAGWPGFSARDAQRIIAAAKLARLKRIDTLVVTHHHTDHVGGVAQLADRFPIGMFVDHGPSVETGNRYPEAYAAVTAKAQHRVVKPGDNVAVKGIEVEVLTANGEHTNRPGQPDPLCAGIQRKPDDNTENPMSVGLLVAYGKFRFVDLGDLTWNKELDLACPENRVGQVDVYLVTHHGSQESPKAIVHAMRPRVAIFNNGAKKGAMPAAWRVVKASPGLEDMWQLHFAVAGGKETNVPDTFIANLDEPCEGKYIKLSANPDGSFTIWNSRNKYTKTYAASR